MGRERAARRLASALIALAVLHGTARASAIAASNLSALDMAPSPAAPLDLVVNGAVRDPVQVVLRDGDALVAIDDLEAAGLRGLEGRRETIAGRMYVSLASLAPAVRFEVDEGALALRITAQPELLGRAAIDLRPTGRPTGLEVRGEPSGFVNYSVQHRTDGQTSGFAEAGVSADGRLLQSSGQLLPNGAAVRGLTSLTLDDPRSLRRLVIGDGFAGSSGLGGGVLLGGLSLAREYALDPYFIRAPMPQLSGFASTPSTLDVYVNGVLTRQVPLAPGGYDVTNLPVTAGAGNVHTVLRDAFGRTEALDWRYYYTPGLLTPGLSDYSYALGFRRLRYGTDSFEYGRPVLVGRHRVGLAERLTMGVRLDAAPDLVSAGPSATVGLPFGTLELEAAASANAGTLGAAASAGYSFVSRRAGGGVLVRVLGDGYAHAALRAVDDRARVQAAVYAGAPIARRVNVGFSYSLLDRRDAGLSNVLSARSDVGLARNLTLGITGSRTATPSASTSYEVFASLIWAFAPMSVADTTVQAVRGGDGAVHAGVQRGLPAGTGYGYRARTGSGPTGESATGVLQYQWEHGRYELQYDRVADAGIGAATVSGGVVVLGDRLFLTRPVQDGYGLIRVGVPGIRGYSEGQEIGRTDRKGDLLVPRLLPYYGNRLAIADRDVPVEYHVGRTELLAAPTLRAGVVTRFDVAPLRAVEGELVASGPNVVPSYGELSVRVAREEMTSPIGGDGRFYLESLPAGTHWAHAVWSGGRCRVMLVVPESPPVIDLGPLRCEPEEKAPVLVERSGGAEGASASAEEKETATATTTTTETATATETATKVPATAPSPQPSPPVGEREIVSIKPPKVAPAIKAPKTAAVLETPKTATVLKTPKTAAASKSPKTPAVKAPNAAAATTAPKKSAAAATNAPKKYTAAATKTPKKSTAADTKPGRPERSDSARNETRRKATVAMVDRAAAAPARATTSSIPVPPPRGFGPRTPRCPSCAMCFSAAQQRISTPTAQLRCIEDVAVMQPSLGAAGAGKLCLDAPGLRELCAQCVRLRELRRCPTWPPER